MGRVVVMTSGMGSHGWGLRQALVVCRLWQLLVNACTEPTYWGLAVEVLRLIFNLNSTQQFMLVLILGLHILTYEAWEELADPFRE